MLPCSEGFIPSIARLAQGSTSPLISTGASSEDLEDALSSGRWNDAVSPCL